MAGSTKLLTPGGGGVILTPNASISSDVVVNLPTVAGTLALLSQAGGIPAGTLMLFQQTAAPTGWTKQTTHNDKALRVVSGTAGSGGSVAFSTAMASQPVSGSVSVALSDLAAGATTLSTAQMPSHNHLVAFYNSTAPYSNSINFLQNPDFANTNTRNTSNNSSSTGGGGSHTHSVSGSASGSFTGNAINLAVQYVDLIIASKD